MKRLLILLAAVSLLIPSCKKNSSNSEPKKEDKITVEILVTENGVPKPGIMVEITASIGEISVDFAPGFEINENERFLTTKTEDGVTLQNGIAKFVYTDNSMPDDNKILITSIKIVKSGSTVVEDYDEKEVLTNTTARFEYDI